MAGNNPFDQLLEDIENGIVEYHAGGVGEGPDVSTVGDVIAGESINTAEHNRVMDNAQLLGITETRLPIAQGETVVRAESGKPTIGYTVQSRVVGTDD
ncbi:hypothetical protein L5I01_21955 [Gordonia sp. HY442]|uniref:hypothetical protein n=1 Tax=Gordonia zhenghanii TaxID=2911516 RepID=UPI001F19E0E3|nr:hypothetical protein [Gordonia zhenghanii]MCF8606020.1 hypothetical protein [Gordonia zhenghanii]